MTTNNGAPIRIDYQPSATWSSDLQVVKSMFFADVKGATQQERLESFYVTQADLYDSYRCRMLHGRFPMVNAMPAPKGGTWVDMGGGTGSNLEFFGDKLNHWGKVVVLDLCPSLVETAQKRVRTRGWESFVSVVLGDACDFECKGMYVPPSKNYSHQTLQTIQCWLTNLTIHCTGQLREPWMSSHLVMLCP